METERGCTNEGHDNMIHLELIHLRIQRRKNPTMYSIGIHSIRLDLFKDIETLTPNSHFLHPTRDPALGHSGDPEVPGPAVAQLGGAPQSPLTCHHAVKGRSVLDFGLGG